MRQLIGLSCASWRCCEHLYCIPRMICKQGDESLSHHAGSSDNSYIILFFHCEYLFHFFNKKTIAKCYCLHNLYVLLAIALHPQVTVIPLFTACPAQMLRRSALRRFPLSQRFNGSRISFPRLLMNHAPLPCIFYTP